MRDHTVLPAIHLFIHKWNEPYMPLLPTRRASPHFGLYSFSILLRVEGWVGLSGWLQTEVVTHPLMITHPITNRARHRVTSLIETNALPLSPAATQVLVYQVIAAVLLARVLFFCPYERCLGTRPGSAGFIGRSSGTCPQSTEQIFGDLIWFHRDNENALISKCALDWGSVNNTRKMNVHRYMCCMWIFISRVFTTQNCTGFGYHETGSWSINCQRLLMSWCFIVMPNSV